MVVTMVMVTAYCYGRRTHTSPRRKGSFPAIFQYGGASAALRYRLARKQGLQGLRFAPDGAGRWVEFRISAGLCGIAVTQKVRTWVRTRFAGLHPVRAENGQGQKLNAGAGLRLICRLNCRNRPTSEPDSVTVEKPVLAGTCDR